MRVLAFGGRNFSDYGKAMDHLTWLHYRVEPITLLIHGAANGADKICAHIAENVLHVPTRAFPANWDDVLTPGAVIRYRNSKPYNAAAGGWRNQQMIDEGKPDCGFGLPGGTGTADMAKRLRAIPLHVWNGGFENDQK